jgi:hypothetical protein
MDEWFRETRNTRIVLCQPCDDPLLHNSVWVGVWKTSYQPSIFTATNSACSRIGLMRKVWNHGSVGTNGACQPDSLCLVLHHLSKDWFWEGMPVDTAAPFVAQMADADPPLAVAMAALQQKIASLEKTIASLEKTIQDADKEMERKGRDCEYQAKVLGPKDEQLAKMREEKIILLRQQSRTQEGTPRPVCALPTTRCLVCIVEIMHHWFSLTLIVQLVTLAPYGHSYLSHQATTSSIHFKYFHGLKCPAVIALVDTLSIRRTSLVLCHAQTTHAPCPLLERPTVHA